MRCGETGARAWATGTGIVFELLYNVFEPRCGRDTRACERATSQKKSQSNRVNTVLPLGLFKRLLRSSAFSPGYSSEGWLIRRIVESHDPTGLAARAEATRAGALRQPRATTRARMHLMARATMVVPKARTTSVASRRIVPIVVPASFPHHCPKNAPKLSLCLSRPHRHRHTPHRPRRRRYHRYATANGSTTCGTRLRTRCGWSPRGSMPAGTPRSTAR